MTDTKEFPTEAVISAITGRLICEIGGVYEVLQFMSGGPVWTRQLGRVGKEAWPVVTAMHPALDALVAETGKVNPDNWREWRDRWIERYGPTIAVPRMTEAQHERIDPLSELAERVHPDRIIVADPAEGAAQ